LKFLFGLVLCFFFLFFMLLLNNGKFSFDSFNLMLQADHLLDSKQCVLNE